METQDYILAGKIAAIVGESLGRIDGYIDFMLFSDEYTSKAGDSTMFTARNTIKTSLGILLSIKENTTITEVFLEMVSTLQDKGLSDLNSYIQAHYTITQLLDNCFLIAKILVTRSTVPMKYGVKLQNKLLRRIAIMNDNSNELLSDYDVVKRLVRSFIYEYKALDAQSMEYAMIHLDKKWLGVDAHE